MIKQSREHKNLPPQWQGERPDYDLFGTAHPSYTYAMQPDFSQTFKRNQKTITRLLAAFEMRRQYFAQ